MRIMDIIVPASMSPQEINLAKRRDVVDGARDVSSRVGFGR